MEESIIVPMHKKGDKTDCNNYRGISLLPIMYKILSNILLSRLIPYAEEIIGGHQCGFWRNRSTTDHIFCIHQILEKKWEHNEAGYQLFIDFKKAYDSVRREASVLILSSHLRLRLSSDAFPQGSPPKHCIRPLSSPHKYYMLRPFQFSWTYHAHNIRWGEHIIKVFIM